MDDKCDYQIADKCDGTLLGRKGTPHKVLKGNSKGGIDPSHEMVTKYACIECEMCFDED